MGSQSALTHTAGLSHAPRIIRGTNPTRPSRLLRAPNTLSFASFDPRTALAAGEDIPDCTNYLLMHCHRNNTRSTLGWRCTRRRLLELVLTLELEFFLSL
ncbi:hypothetical protein P692DRAFT_20339839 [Suillus brevipes Sb2]|nr:hypothetical protein P692DRAFT_20339839 [Suillus brevipes Sb2]